MGERLQTTHEKNIAKCEFPSDSLLLIVRRFRQAADVAAVYVLGSYARGDYRKDSDLDLYVVVDGYKRDKLHTMIDLNRAVADLNIDMDIIVDTAGNFYDSENLEDVKIPVRKEGLMIYG